MMGKKIFVFAFAISLTTIAYQNCAQPENEFIAMDSLNSETEEPVLNQPLPDVENLNVCNIFESSGQLSPSTFEIGSNSDVLTCSEHCTEELKNDPQSTCYYGGKEISGEKKCDIQSASTQVSTASDEQIGLKDCSEICINADNQSNENLKCTWGDIDITPVIPPVVTKKPDDPISPITEPQIACTPFAHISTMGSCSKACGGGTQTLNWSNGCGSTWSTTQNCNTQICQNGLPTEPTSEPEAGSNYKGWCQHIPGKTARWASFNVIHPGDKCHNAYEAGSPGYPNGASAPYIDGSTVVCHVNDTPLTESACANSIPPSVGSGLKYKGWCYYPAGQPPMWASFNVHQVGNECINGFEAGSPSYPNGAAAPYQGYGKNMGAVVCHVSDTPLNWNACN